MDELDRFKYLTSKVFHFHVPLMGKYLRKNLAPFMNNNLCKAIMTRSRHLNKFWKNKKEIIV